MCYVRSAFACEIILAKFPQRLQNLENVKKKIYISTLLPRVFQLAALAQSAGLHITFMASS